jgi:type III pantothenate kinase
MIITLDVGNTQIYGGVFDHNDLKLQFRRHTQTNASSDEIGLFLVQVLRENGINPESITQVAVATVVPDLIHSLRNACLKYFKKSPFILQPGVKTGLNLKCPNPQEVGADRIANAIAATHLFPKKNLIIIDFGTANTLCVLTKEKQYLGGLIFPGMRTGMEALVSKTAKLPKVELVTAKDLIGKTTIDNIQGGLYFEKLYSLKGIVRAITEEQFPNDSPLTIGTGGFARLFQSTSLFDYLVPELVLIGIKRACDLNMEFLYHDSLVS